MFSRSLSIGEYVKIGETEETLLDVFTENGVLIMSPPYRSDPPQPQVVVPEDAWAARDPRPARSPHR